MARRDYTTQDFFEVPQPASPVPGSMDYRHALCALVSAMLNKSGQTRFALSAKASELAGKEISKSMLDAYCAESREDFNLPAYLIPSIEVAAGSHDITNWLAGVRGGRLLIGRDALSAELGRIQREKDQLNAAERALKDQLRSGR